MSSFTKTLLAAAGAAALFAPSALAAPIDGGQRNPNGNASSGYTNETQIIGEIAQNAGGGAPTTGGFVTRQSNKSDSGGGAIYGCRARAGTEACIASNNLNNGDAFRFQATPNAATIGQLRFGLDINRTVDKPPFVTNGTGLVKHLNADRLDGKSAEEFVEKGTLLFASVAADGAIGANRGVIANGRATVEDTGDDMTITVPFTGDLKACAPTANPTADPAGASTAPFVVALGTNPTTIAVIQRDSDVASPFALQVIC